MKEYPCSFALDVFAEQKLRFCLLLYRLENFKMAAKTVKNEQEEQGIKEQANQAMEAGNGKKIRTI